MTYAILDLIAAVLSLLGSLLCLTAAAGLVRFPDLVSRMHPAAKPLSLGMVLLLVGLALHIRTLSAALFLALVTILQMMTVTLSSHVVARSGYRSGLVDPDTLVVDELAEAINSRRRAGVVRTSARRSSPRAQSPTGDPGGTPAGRGSENAASRDTLEAYEHRDASHPGTDDRRP